MPAQIAHSVGEYLMELDEVLKLKKIAKVIKVDDEILKWQIAKEMNEIAKILIEIYHIKKQGGQPWKSEL